MVLDSVSPLLLFLVATAFVVFGAGAAAAASSYRRGRVGGGRRLLVALWLLASIAVGLVGYRQYGVWSVLPALLAVALSTVVIHFVAQRAARGAGGVATVAVLAAGAAVAAIVLPAALLLFVVSLGIDGP